MILKRAGRKTAEQNFSFQNKTSITGITHLPAVENKIRIMTDNYNITDWLPASVKEITAREWDGLDVIVISGDAYVDHPSFGHAVIGRIIEDEGLRVAIVPQPNWRDDLRDFRKFGKPELFFAVTSGCMDSMVNHYTAARRLRSTDAYTPGGKSGFRPDYAVTEYTKILKNLYPDVPVLIGGIEGSLRRFTHYDYWSDRLKPSILKDSGADLLVYGMGEKPLREIIRLLKKGVPFGSIKTMPQTALLQKSDLQLPKNKKWETVELSSHEECLENKKSFASNFRTIETQACTESSHRIIQKIGKEIFIVNPPFPEMTEKEIDASFELPYTRLPHPRYKKKGSIPAFEMIKYSVNMHRGCFGGCGFCAITAHQGRRIISRSQKSVLKEVQRITHMPGFRGHVTDLGGPTANMYRMNPLDRERCSGCRRPSCLYPEICTNLDTDHGPLIDIYKKASSVDGVKKISIGSGIRYDMLVGRTKQETDKNSLDEYMTQVFENHVSGRLKVAPEHTSDKVLKVMRKPSFRLYRLLAKRFHEINRKKGLEQQIIPYFISSHPGSTVRDMASLAVETKELGVRLEQVQDFTPTPMTLSTVIYYSGYHPYTLEPVNCAVKEAEKLEQRRFFFWYKKENRSWIMNKLKKMGLDDMSISLFNSSDNYSPAKKSRKHR